MDELIHPNLHVVLVHYPLALLTIGTLIELFSFLWRRHGFRWAGHWMILLGALGAVPTITSGIYAFRHVASMGTPYEHAPAAWKDLSKASPLSNDQWEAIQHHLLHESFSTALALIVVVTWIGCSDRWRARMRLPLLALLLISVFFASLGAYNAGEAVYAYGTAVNVSQRRDATTAPATQASETSGASSSAPATARIADSPAFRSISRVAPPIQMHVIFAGVAVALGLASLSLSIRKTTFGVPEMQVDHLPRALGPSTTVMSSEGSETFAEIPLAHDALPRVPASRFWMLTFLVALLTALGGYTLVMLHQDRFWSFNDFWDIIRDHNRQGNYRLLGHLAAGGSIVVLPLLLSLVSRWLPRGKWLLILLTLLLIGAIAAQILFGVELLYDSRQGPLLKFG